MKNGKHKRWEGYWKLTVNRLFKTVNRLKVESNTFPKPLTVYEKRKTQKIGRLLEINGKSFYFKRLTDYHQRATYLPKL